LSASVNAERALYAEAPVNSDATAGTESVLKMLASGLDPTMTVSRTLDGQGGAYEHQFDAPLGRFARLNANLSFEVDSFSDLPYWSSNDGGVSNYSFNLTDRPRRLQVSHDGSGSSDDRGGVVSSVLTTSDSLGSFRITFSDVSFTNNNGGDALVIGISDLTPDINIGSNGNGVYIEDGSGTNLLLVRNGSSSRLALSNIDFSIAHDLTIEYNGSEARILIDGVLENSVPFSNNSSFSPLIQIKEESSVSASETVSVGQITVEPIGGTF
jgi:hypothetical protein